MISQVDGSDDGKGGGKRPRTSRNDPDQADLSSAAVNARKAATRDKGDKPIHPSYTTYGSLPTRVLHELLEYIDDQSCNSMRLLDKTQVTTNTLYSLLYIGVGRTPKDPLDYHDRQRLKTVMRKEYERRGRPWVDKSFSTIEVEAQKELVANEKLATEAGGTSTAAGASMVADNQLPARTVATQSPLAEPSHAYSLHTASNSLQYLHQRLLSREGSKWLSLCTPHARGWTIQESAGKQFLHHAETNTSVWCTIAFPQAEIEVVQKPPQHQSLVPASAETLPSQPLQGSTISKAGAPASLPAAVVPSDSSDESSDENTVATVHRQSSGRQYIQHPKLGQRWLKRLASDGADDWHIRVEPDSSREMIASRSNQHKPVWVVRVYKTGSKYASTTPGEIVQPIAQPHAPSFIVPSAMPPPAPVHRPPMPHPEPSFISPSAIQPPAPVQPPMPAPTQNFISPSTMQPPAPVQLPTPAPTQSFISPSAMQPPALVQLPMPSHAQSFIWPVAMQPPAPVQLPMPPPISSSILPSAMQPSAPVQPPMHNFQDALVLLSQLNSIPLPVSFADQGLGV